jgi:hypothetical protein
MNEHYKDRYIKYKNKYFNFKIKNSKKLEGGNIFIYGGISIIIILISLIFYIEKLRIDESKKKLTLEQSSEQVTQSVSEPVTEPMSSSSPAVAPAAVAPAAVAPAAVAPAAVAPAVTKPDQPVNKRVYQQVTEQNSLLSTISNSENGVQHILMLPPTATATITPTPTPTPAAIHASSPAPTTPSAPPSGVPSGVPSDVPSDVPSGVPSDMLGADGGFYGNMTGYLQSFKYPV